MTIQQVTRGGVLRNDKRTGELVEEAGTFRYLLVKPTEQLIPAGATHESPPILSRAEIARRRDANR